LPAATTVSTIPVAAAAVVDVVSVVVFVAAANADIFRPTIASLPRQRLILRGKTPASTKNVVSATKADDIDCAMAAKISAAKENDRHASAAAAAARKKLRTRSTAASWNRSSTSWSLWSKGHRSRRRRPSTGSWGEEKRKRRRRRNARRGS